MRPKWPTETTKQHFLTLICRLDHTIKLFLFSKIRTMFMLSCKCGGCASLCKATKLEGHKGLSRSYGITRNQELHSLARSQKSWWQVLLYIYWDIPFPRETTASCRTWAALYWSFSNGGFSCAYSFSNVFPLQTTWNPLIWGMFWLWKQSHIFIAREKKEPTFDCWI